MKERPGRANGFPKDPPYVYTSREISPISPDVCSTRLGSTSPPRTRFSARRIPTWPRVSTDRQFLSATGNVLRRGPRAGRSGM